MKEFEKPVLKTLSITETQSGSSSFDKVDSDIYTVNTEVGLVAYYTYSSNN